MKTKFWSPNKKYVKASNTPRMPTAPSMRSLKIPKIKFKKPSKKFLTISGGVLGVLVAVFVVLYIFILGPVREFYGEVRGLKDNFGKLQEGFLARDLPAMEASFGELEQGLHDVRKSRDENLGWVRNVGFTKGYYEDSDHFINAGLYAIDAGREAVVLVTPFADAAGFKVNAEDETAADLSLLDAFSNWISIMPEIAENSDVLLDKISLVGDELTYVDTSKYPEEFREYPVRSTLEMVKTSLSEADDYAPDIKEALTIIPGLLGVNTGERRYMIIMQNDKEIRATGGFWTNYATFKMHNGLLTSDFTSKDMYSVDLALDAIDAIHTFPTVPPAYQKYLKVERMFSRDANISPDFPTAVDLFMTEFYNLGMRVAPREIKPVDGVLAIDTDVISEFIEVTGPVTVNGVTYDSSNVILELENIASLALQEQAGRKKVLGDLMEAMLVNVFESDKGLWPELVNKGVDLAGRKHLTAYHFDPVAQRLLEKYNIAGRIVEPEQGDYSFVVQTNLGGDKTNWFVDKQVDHTLTQENDRWVREVKLTYTYNEPSAEYGAFLKRFRDWVRVYAPGGSELISVEGSADDTKEIEGEMGKSVFTGYLELGPGESGVMTFKYYLPEGAVVEGVYDLYIQKQSGIDSEVHTVTVGGTTETFEVSKDLEYTRGL